MFVDARLAVSDMVAENRDGVDERERVKGTRGARGESSEELESVGVTGRIISRVEVEGAERSIMGLEILTDNDEAWRE